MEHALVSTKQADPFAPYFAANGHKMVPGRMYSRNQGKNIPVFAWARCTDDCPACAGGDHPNDYAGEDW